MKDNRYFYMEDIDCVVTVEYASRKELLELLDNHIDNVRTYNEMIANGNPNACYYENNDDVFEILYKDGTTDYINDEYDGHKIRRQNIASIVYCNSSTYMVYGNFEISENGIASPAFEDAIDESLKEVDSEDYTESAPEQTAEQEQQEETATTESGNQDNAETDTYEHALKMAMYAAECGDGVQAIFHKDGKFKAGLVSDREYAEKNGWQYFHTVWETIPEEERTRAEKLEEIKEARKKSLFWAKRMCYKSADYHPEWKEEYEKAKKHVEEVEAKYEETEPEEPVQEANTESGTVLDKSDWNGKIARLKAVVSYFKSHNMHWEANKAYKHNWKFYREHTAEECIKIIHEECTQKTGIQV